MYITKHKWDCDWYWSLGYIGNASLHTHFDAVFLTGRPYVASDIFENPKFTDNQWWVIRDLFIQAYALKEAAAVYQHGGYQCKVKGITDIIIDNGVAIMLNKDLEKVLNKVWDYIIECREKSLSGGKSNDA